MARFVAIIMAIFGGSGVVIVLFMAGIIFILPYLPLLFLVVSLSHPLIFRRRSFATLGAHFD